MTLKASIIDSFLYTRTVQGRRKQGGKGGSFPPRFVNVKTFWDLIYGGSCSITTTTPLAMNIFLRPCSWLQCIRYHQVKYVYYTMLATSSWDLCVCNMCRPIVCIPLHVDLNKLRSKTQYLVIKKCHMVFKVQTNYSIINFCRLFF